MIEGIYQAWQTWLMWACLGALAVCLFALAVLCAIPELTDAIRRFCGMDKFSKVVCGVCIVGAVLYGGSKGVNVRWDDGLADNGTLITNDTVAVRWTYSGIPSASSVFIDYREAGTTNDWLNLAETLASALSWTGTLANATNYDYWVYSTYVPPVPVHTNGVWVGQAYETKARVGAKSFLILNGLVQEHGRTIATPAEKRKDAEKGADAKSYIQDGLVAMWDGIENAGWGVHDENATVWKDLMGSYDGTVGANVVVMDNCMSFNGTKGEANAVKVGKVTFGSPQFVTFEAVFIKDHDEEVSVYNEAVFGQTESRTSMVTMFVKSRLSVQYVKLGTSTTLGINYGSAPFGLREMMSASFRYASDKIQLFKDGVVVASQSNDSTPIDMSSTSYNFYIGGDAYNPEEYTLLGRVFNLRIYNRALTAEEIAYNHKIDKERFNLP